MAFHPDNRLINTEIWRSREDSNPEPAD